MSRRIPKSVSISQMVNELIEKHFQRRGEFSAFVRAAVIDHDERVNKGGGPHSPIEGLNICNAMRRPTCSICYPEGPPTRQNWLKFMAQVGPADRFMELGGPMPSRDGRVEIHLATQELLASIEPKPPRPRVDEVTGTFPKALTPFQRLKRLLGFKKS